MARTSEQTIRPRRLTRFLTYLLTLTFLITIMPVRTLAWGSNGHKVTALIAYALLTPRAKHNVDAVLQGRSIADVSVWPDDFKRANCAVPGANCNPNYRPETSQWHFVDMPLSGDGHYSPNGEYCRTSLRYGDCIVPAIEDFRAILDKSTNRPFANQNVEQKRKLHDALSFIVHFLGDIHQPLHCADNHDFGGNGVLVSWEDEPPYQFGPIWNLHSVWDDYIVTLNIMKMPAAQRTYDKYANFLVNGSSAAGVKNLSAAERNYATRQSDTIETGRPENVIAWAESSHAVARNSTYKLPTTTGTKNGKTVVILDENYFTTNMPVVQTQLRLGGVRLARILNDIYDKDIQ